MVRSIAAAVAILAVASCSNGGGVPSGPATAASSSGLQFQALTAPTSVFPTTIGNAPTGIVGSFVTNTVVLTGGATLGALYNLTTRVWTPIQVPSSGSTAAYGPAITTAGYRIVGSYQTTVGGNDHGFFFDSGTNAFTTIDAPSNFCAPGACNETIAHSNYGDAPFMVVGNCDAIGSSSPGFGIYPATGHAFLYNSANAGFTKIDMPAAISTTAYGIWIDGSEVAVAGGFTDARATHAYVRGLTSETMVSYDYPGAAVTHFEGITGAGGAGNYNVIGDYGITGQNTGFSGFFLPIRNWVAGTPVPLGSSVSANSVFQRTVVGITSGSLGIAGYIITVPGS